LNPNISCSIHRASDWFGETNTELTITDIQGEVIDKQEILAGSTMAFFDVSTSYPWTFVISYTDVNVIQRKKILVL
jgi:hypothetical protein